MKNLLFALILPLLVSCKSDDNQNTAISQEPQSLTNVSYGPHSQQLMDLYLPEGHTNQTKVLILVHGGGWTSGSKQDMNYAIPILQLKFPEYAIVNIDYRLATIGSPAFPKQIDDIALAIAFLENSNYGISQQYAFMGVSAGAHLSLLYSYNFDPAHKVKAVCSLVGPTDFTDPAYLNNDIILQYLPFVVPDGATEAFYAEVSPATHVSAQSPPTIQFAGDHDPLVPVSQGLRLKAQLDTFGVTNELHVYNAAHGDFSITDSQQIFQLLDSFFEIHF